MRDKIPNRSSWPTPTRVVGDRLYIIAFDRYETRGDWDALSNNSWRVFLNGQFVGRLCDLAYNGGINFSLSPLRWMGEQADHTAYPDGYRWHDGGPYSTLEAALGEFVARAEVIRDYREAVNHE